MSRIARIWSAVRERPRESLLYLVGGAYLVACCCVAFGRFGIPAAFVAIYFFARVSFWHSKRHPRQTIREIGPIEIELTACNTGNLSPKIALWSFVTLSITWGLVLGAEVLSLLCARLGIAFADPPDSRIVLQQTFFFLVVTASSYVSYRNRLRRVVVTHQGLFQIVDPTRPWPTDRDLNDPRSPLRAMKLYGWEQVARFHWSAQQGKCVLHLSVRQPEFPVPQLHSYRLPLISEEQRRELDQILQRYATCVASQPGGCNLTGLLQNARPA